MDTKSLDSHKDITNSERQLKEKSVSSTVRAFSAFTNPFEMSTDAIVCLSSGKKESEDVASDKRLNCLKFIHRGINGWHIIHKYLFPFFVNSCEIW